MAGDTVDKEIEDRFGGLLGIGLGDTPARKMTVDVHPGKAVHQGAAGNLHPFRIRRAQLSLHGGLRLPGLQRRRGRGPMRGRGGMALRLTATASSRSARTMRAG